MFSAYLRRPKSKIFVLVMPFSSLLSILGTCRCSFVFIPLSVVGMIEGKLAELLDF